MPPVWSMFMIDSIFHLVNRGPEHPDEFPRLIICTLILLGCFMLALVIVVTLLIIWAALTGRLMTGAVAD